MHATRIDIAENAPRGVTALLNGRLADLIDLRLAPKQAHWNVKRPHFIALHELFDRLQGALDAHVDDTAERITALRGTASGSVQAVAAATPLKPYPGDLFDGLRVVEGLADRTAAVTASVRKGFEETAGTGGADAADPLTPLSPALDESRWFPEARLQRG